MDEDKRNLWRNLKLTPQVSSRIILSGSIFLVLLIVSLLLFPLSSKSKVLPATTANITVNASQSIGSLGDIFGTLLREVYFRADDPIRPWAAIRYATQTIDRMLELAPINGQKIPIRGISDALGTTDGAYGNDGGHWRRIDPDFPDRFDPGDDPGDPFGSDVDEYQEYVRRVNGQSQIVINFGSSKSNEAAGLVSYLNGTDTSDPDVQLRTAHGFPQPYNVTTFEIGNELYASWETGFSATQPCSYANPSRPTTCLGEADLNWYNKPTSNIDNYANRLVEFTRAMRAKSPIPITIYAVGGDWALGFPIGIGGETWIKRLISIAGDDIDGFVLHFYPDNSYFGEDDVSLLGRVEAYPSTRTGTGIESFANGIDLARNWANQQRAADGKSSKDYKIAVTEYNFRASTGGFEAQGYSLVNGLFIADNLRLYANKGIDLANYFAIRMTETSNSAFSLFHNSDVNRPAPMFYALKLFTKHFGTQVVNSSVSGSNIITAPGGNRGSFQYDSLTSTASLSSDGKTLYLIVVNKDLVNAQTANIDIQNFPYNTSVRAWELNGPTPESTNEVADTVKITELGSVSLSSGYTFPAHSATAFELTQGPGGPTPTPTPSGAGFNLVADVSSEETALGMVEYGGSLYAATHTNPKNSGPGTIVRYNDSTGTYGTAYSIPVGQGLGDIRVINNKIYVTSLDSGTASRGEIYTYDGSSWQQITFPSSDLVGLGDIAFYNNRYYAVGYTYAGIAKVFSSADGTTNWVENYSYNFGGAKLNRFTQAAVFNGKLFFTHQTSNEGSTNLTVKDMYADKDIFYYDGASFSSLDFTTQPMQVTDMEVFNNALYLSIWNKTTNVPGMLKTTDGVNFSQVPFFGPSSKAPSLLDLVTYNSKLYVAEYVTGSIKIYESSDGTNWTQTYTVPATVSAYGDYAWYIHPAFGVYKGKLYLIPPAEGKLYVLGSSSATPTPTGVAPTPTPTPRATPTPTPTPGIIPLMTPTPTPTGGHMVTPTPTPTPTPKDTTAPQVMITNPKNGATVSGKVTISAVASDNVRVTKVEFYLNNKLTFTDTSSPYSYSWNTSSYANGHYTIMVKAYDAAGNTSSNNIMVNKVKRSWWKFW